MTLAWTEETSRECDVEPHTDSSEINSEAGKWSTECIILMGAKSEAGWRNASRLALFYRALQLQQTKG